MFVGSRSLQGTNGGGVVAPRSCQHCSFQRNRSNRDDAMHAVGVYDGEGLRGMDGIVAGLGGVMTKLNAKAEVS